MMKKIKGKGNRQGKKILETDPQDKYKKNIFLFHID